MIYGGRQARPAELATLPMQISRYQRYRLSH
jgi:hypothetical protein